MEMLEVETRGVAVFCLLLVGLASASLGISFTFRVTGFASSGTWRTVLQIVMGYTLLGWVVLIANWLGLSSRLELIGLLIFLSLPAATACLRAAAAALPRFTFSSMRPPGHSAWLAALGLLTLAPALCPPETWDELVYHAELPKRWLADEKIACYFDLPYSGFPSLCEIVSLSVSTMDGMIAPRLISAVAWLVAVAMLFSMASSYVPSWVAVIIAAAFACSEAVLLVSGGGYVEPQLTLNLAAMLMLFLHARKHTPPSTIRLALMFGLLAAGCGAVKLTGIVMLPVAMLMLTFCKPQLPSRHRELFRAMLALVLIAAVCLVPFYLRPWLETGNPFFPYFETWFTADANRIESSLFHHAIGSERFGGQGLPALLLSPVLLGFNQAVFDGSLGLQFCLILAVAIAGLVSVVRAGSAQPEMVLLFFVALGLLVFWALTAQQARFAIAAAFVISILVALSLAQFSPRIRNLLALALLGLTLISAPWGTTWYYLGAWMSNLGWVDGKTLVDEGTGFEYLPLVEAIDALTEEDARIMLLLEHRSFYISRTTVIGSPFFQSQAFNPPEAFTSAESVLGVLMNEGIAYLILPTQPLGPDFSLARAERLVSLRQGIEAAAASGWLELVWQSATYQLLKVNPPQPLKAASDGA